MLGQWLFGALGCSYIMLLVIVNTRIVKLLAISKGWRQSFSLGVRAIRHRMALARPTCLSRSNLLATKAPQPASHDCGSTSY